MIDHLIIGRMIDPLIIGRTTLSSDNSNIYIFFFIIPKVYLDIIAYLFGMHYLW